MKVLLLHSRIRVEEKLLLSELDRRGHAVTLQPVDDFSISLPRKPGELDVSEFDLVLDRCLSQTKALGVVRILETFGARCVNSSQVAALCGDKLSTNLALLAGGVPVPRAAMGFSPAAGLRAVETLGYPAVLKPVVGSWGRLLAKLNDRDAAEAILEHKQTLGGPQHGLVYAQEFVEKGGRDIRSFVIGGRVACAIERHSEHWITNTARGAQALGIQVTPAMESISLAAARAVGGDLIAVDIFEGPTGELLVCEVNATMEFRNSIETTGVDIAAVMVDEMERIVEHRDASTALEAQHA